MFRPSTDLGMPAFGCAASGSEVTARTRSTHAAVDTDHVDVPLRKAGSEGLGIRTVEAVAVFVNRHMRDDRNLGIHIAAGEHSLM